MNLQTHLRDAVWILCTFATMGLCFAVQQWEDRKFSVACITAEVQGLYNLDEVQARLIQQINYDFYDEVSKASIHHLFDEQKCEQEIETLTQKKNAAVMKVVKQGEKRGAKEWVVEVNHRQFR
ncbi:hypothetical protein [Chryseolinea lacunae]|uniref:Uncharacterized protein n=1 Tax=Chryseolinea lacunae TaxID=2801331 RepID=A0ABS1KJJ0_9BACT|nr:hypothetical protein [Chryseolinea lacunae]MBL0739621.1 hypothetical protein [Chryseolinea lacunae]